MLLLKLDHAPASGTLGEIFTINCRGLGPLRLIVENQGAAALTAAQVLLAGSEAATPEIFDTTTFATLAAAAIKSLVIPEPVEILALRVSGSTQLAVQVISPQKG